MTNIVEIEPGHEIERDRAKRTDGAVLVRSNGIWIELRPENADHDQKIAIARLELERGDILVIKGPVLQHRPDLSYFLPTGVRVMWITPEMELSVLTKAEIEARI